ncbi:MAG: hypothetical protein ACP5PM_09915 [Acidimicrobiales bacterium]
MTERLSETAQPTMSRLKASVTNALSHKPASVETWVRSATQAARACSSSG